MNVVLWPLVLWELIIRQTQNRSRTYILNAQNMLIANTYELPVVLVELQDVYEFFLRDNYS